MLVLARQRRAELHREVARLENFLSTADALIHGTRTEPPPPAVDPFQALFNSGEVLPPLGEDDGEWRPLDPAGVHFVRTEPGRM